MDTYDHTAVIDWDALRTRYLAERANTAPTSRWTSNAVRVMKRRYWENPSFVGAEMHEVDGWVKDGFNPPEFAAAAAYVQPAMHGDWVYDEEGENVDVGAALSGDDAPFVDWQDSPTRPGLKVTLDFSFPASVPAGIIAEYGAWVAGMLANFEAQGIDLEIDVATPSPSEMFTDAPSNSVQTIIRVKRPHEIVPFSDWSVLFSPGGFRCLGFTAIVMASEHLQHTLDQGFGASARQEKWEIEYAPKSRSMHVHPITSPSAFPADDMTQQLRDAGLA